MGIDTRNGIRFSILRINIIGCAYENCTIRLIINYFLFVRLNGDIQKNVVCNSIVQRILNRRKKK
jgi:hypothetical protein